MALRSALLAGLFGILRALWSLAGSYGVLRGLVRLTIFKDRDLLLDDYRHRRRQGRTKSSSLCLKLRFKTMDEWTAGTSSSAAWPINLLMLFVLLDSLVVGTYVIFLDIKGYRY